MKSKGIISSGQTKKFSRREFISAAVATAAFTVVPRYVLGGPGYTAPSEKLNIAVIGAGGQGGRDVNWLNTENIVALCDVDWNLAAETFKCYPNANKYRDFRRMLDKQKNIDAVLVSTPDHTHAVAAMAAIKRSKHVYCQKPLAHSIYEVRKLTEAARKHKKVVTQMGNHLHATNAMKMLVEMLKSGAIGNVHSIHLWTNKPVWPQGRHLSRPTETPAIPSTLNWELWLGPAPYRPYHPAYVPVNWRGWWDFGTGALGDMGCHIFDPAFWALNLGSTYTVEAQSSGFNNETYPSASIVRYEFPARGNLVPVTITWYEGGMLPWRPPELEHSRKLPNQGGLYIGDKGTILAPHMGGPRLIPESKMKDFRPPEPSLPRGVNHYQEWVNACKGGPEPLSNFGYAGPLTEMVLLGNIALRAGKKLKWDGTKMQVTNVPEANQYLRRQYRNGWTL